MKRKIIVTFSMLAIGGTYLMPVAVHAQNNELHSSEVDEEILNTESDSEIVELETFESSTIDSEIEDITESIEESIETKESESISETDTSVSEESSEIKVETENPDEEVLEQENDQIEVFTSHITRKLYASINKITVFLDGNLLETNKTTYSYVNKTFKILNKITDADNNIFYELSDSTGNVLGILKDDVLDISDNIEGHFNSEEVYLTIKNSSYPLFNDFENNTSIETTEYNDKVLLSKGYYNHFNGIKYLSVYDNQDKWLGYIDENGTELSEDGRSKYQSYNQYVTINSVAFGLFENFNWKLKNDVKPYQGKILLAKGYYDHFNGSRYLSVYDNQDRWLGYINEKGTELTQGGQSNYQSYNQHVMIHSTTFGLFENFNWKLKNNVSNYRGQVVFAKGYYDHFNGSRYLSVYDNQDRWLGYINENGTELAEGGQSKYQNYNRHVMIHSTTFGLFENFNWKLKNDVKAYRGQVVLAKGYYSHFNGSRYLSVYDNQDRWLGYINQDGTELADGGQSKYQNYNQYVMINSTAYSLLENFNWKVKNNVSNYKGHIVLAKGYYKHFNGSRYLSVYDNQDRWLGYINEAGTELATGGLSKQQNYHQYVMINSTTYGLFENFNWKLKNNVSNYKDRVVLAKGYYLHFNGSRYLSVFDNQDRWLGYINEAGTELANGGSSSYKSYGKYVSVTSKTMNVFSNFNWQVRNKSSNLYGQSFIAKGYYNHFNGSRYLSLYDHSNKWVGYINENGTRIEQSLIGLESSSNYYVTINRKNFPIYNRMNGGIINNSNKLLGHDYQVKEYHRDAKNIPHVALYSRDGKLVGYINEQATNINVIRFADQEFKKNYGNKKVHLFVMGHGVNDPGAGTISLNERDFTRNELLPYLKKYAAQLKNTHVEFYDVSRNMYQDTQIFNGSRTISNHYASVTELHLDASVSAATGGHVIVNTRNGNTSENRAFAETLRRYSSLWAGVRNTNGLSYRSDLLNLNVFERRDIPYRLIELGFITNSSDVAKIRRNIDSIAKSMIENATGERIR